MEQPITWAELIANAHDDAWVDAALKRPLDRSFFRDLALHVWSIDDRLYQLERQ